jgi:hypothetical protein
MRRNAALLAANFCGWFSGSCVSALLRANVTLLSLLTSGSLFLPFGGPVFCEGVKMDTVRDSSPWLVELYWWGSWLIVADSRGGYVAAQFILA